MGVHVGEDFLDVVGLIGIGGLNADENAAALDLVGNQFGFVLGDAASTSPVEGLLIGAAPC